MVQKSEKGLKLETTKIENARNVEWVNYMTLQKLSVVPVVQAPEEGQWLELRAMVHLQIKRWCMNLLPTGQQEVIEGLAAPEPRSNIDQMIEALANRQYGNDQSPPAASQQPAPSLLRHIASPRSGLCYP
jgi:hypothetical protein